MADKRKSKTTGFYIVLTGLVALLVASWLFAFGGASSIPNSANALVRPVITSTPINETYKFLTYRDPVLNFSLQYPVGFYAEEPSQVVPFRAYSALSGQVTEVIQVFVDNSTSAHAQFRELITESSEAGQTTTITLTTATGKPVTLAKTVTDIPLAPSFSNETGTVYQALFTCTDSESNAYAALLLISIPDGLKQDLPIADYVVNSFKC